MYVRTYLSRDGQKLILRVSIQSKSLSNNSASRLSSSHLSLVTP